MTAWVRDLEVCWNHRAMMVGLGTFCNQKREKKKAKFNERKFVKVQSIMTLKVSFQNVGKSNYFSCFLITQTSHSILNFSIYMMNKIKTALAQNRLKVLISTDNKRRKHKGKNASINIEEICSNVCSRRGIGWARLSGPKKKSVTNSDSKWKTNFSPAPNVHLLFRCYPHRDMTQHVSIIHEHIWLSTLYKCRHIWDDNRMKEATSFHVFQVFKKKTKHSRTHLVFCENWNEVGNGLILKSMS